MSYILGCKPDGSPRDYISWSAYSLWKKSKDQYRKRYYENQKGITTTEMMFGKKIGEMLEKNDTTLAHIPRFSCPEHSLDMEIDGVKVIAYLDSFDPDTCSILEYKTSHLSKEGRIPWDLVKVHAHRQLDWYSMMVKEKYGKVNDVVDLIWMETAFEEKTIMYQGHVLSQGKKLVLTGRVEVFSRRIGEVDRQEIRADIIKTCEEIQNDYEQYKKDNQ